MQQMVFLCLFLSLLFFILAVSSWHPCSMQQRLSWGASLWPPSAQWGWESNFGLWANSGGVDSCCWAFFLDLTCMLFCASLLVFRFPVNQQFFPCFLNGEIVFLRNWWEVDLICADYKILSRALSSRLKDFISLNVDSSQLIVCLMG